ncbi:MAG: hypothetical protein CMM83_01425 [Rhodospirillales bacterium]|nr:hypothetical protein [Rhodospirillales bacterium]|tara:strand:+ start:123 stop:686 length:564 start_codon:yes stop_codon:yes gene_type:complete
MKKILIMILGSWLVLSCIPLGPLFAQTIPIGVIDIQRVIKNSAAARSIRPQMEKLKKVYRTKFKKSELNLQNQKRELQKQRAIMPEGYSKKLKTFQKKVRDTQREVQIVNRMFDRALANSMREVHRTMNGITMEIAQEKSLKFVIPKRLVIFYEETSDITEEVTKRLNKRLPKVKVVMPKAKNLRNN